MQLDFWHVSRVVSAWTLVCCFSFSRFPLAFSPLAHSNQPSSHDAYNVSLIGACVSVLMVYSMTMGDARADALGTALKRGYSSWSRAGSAGGIPSSGDMWRLPACAAAAAAATGLSVAWCSSPSREQSFIMVKPDGFNRGLCGDIIARFERKGYKLVAAKVIIPSEAIAKSHYEEHDGKPFFPKLVNFLTSGPVLALVFEGKGVIGYGRTMIGATNPLSSPPGTIRGDYGIDVGRNIIHGSDSAESAQREISLWFSSHEVAEFDRVVDGWIYE